MVSAVQRLDIAREEHSWRTRAADLARWAQARLVNRTDVWGGYYSGPTGTCQTTHPRKVDRGRIVLNVNVLVSHFRATRTCDVIGLHTTSPVNTSLWGGIDIDKHGEGGNDASANLGAALAWWDRLRGLGFAPLLTDSNGKGGYHLRALFQEPVATPRLFTFLRWLTADHACHGLPAKPETFPKQARVTASGPGSLGNWLRVPGRHHTREHWSRVWDGTTWLAGEAAIEYILALSGDPIELLPEVPEVCPMHRAPFRFAPGHRSQASRGIGRGHNLAAQIASHMAKLPHLAEGQGRADVAYRFAAWLVRDMAVADDIALAWLERWDAGNRPPKGRERLAQILADAHRYGQNPVGCGRGQQCRTDRHGHTIITTGFEVY
jgi:hypothetical protein